MAMKERIAQIIQKEGMTAGQFAEKVGISSSALSHILSGRNNPSLDFVMKIHKACDYISLNWLLYGEGEMETDVEEGENAINPSQSAIPPENRTENESNSPSYIPKEIVREEIKYIEKPSRKITEIRIFFDNGTYEIFKPEN